VLLVVELDAMAGVGVDLRRELVVGHREREDRRGLPGHVHHGQLTLVGLADPALLGELLHEAHALAAGVGEVERGLGVEHGAEHPEHHDGDDRALQPLLALGLRLVQVHRRAVWPA